MSNAQPYQSARARRIHEVTHGLTVDLFLQIGDFWTSIAKYRDLLGIAQSVTKAIPPRLPYPQHPSFALYHDLSCLPGLDEDRPSNFDNQRMWWFCLEWRGVLSGIPPVFAEAFLTGCLVYDPPETKLEAFANHADNLLSGRLATQCTGPEPPPGLPVAWMPDPDELQVAAEDPVLIADLKEAVEDALSSRGLDGAAIWRDAEVEARQQLRQRHGEAVRPTYLVWDDDHSTHRMERSMPTIPIHADTSLGDVREAFRWIRGLQPGDRSASKSSTDVLRCVQCAIWRYSYEWSDVDIGRYFGWTIQTPPDAKPRCETARKYIADGRALLNQ